jgi:hypothetical protein
MAAPSHTARVAPAGIPLYDGHSTTFAFGLDPDISLWEVTLKPPGIDGGELIDITTMHNEDWLTFIGQALKRLTDLTGNALYDPAVWDQILAICNVNGSVTCHLPDGSRISFYGILRVFEPQENQRGQNPRAAFTISPTNWDSTNRTEEGPVVSSVAGT